MQRTRLAFILIACFFLASHADAALITGNITWLESSNLSFGDGVHNLNIVWSTRHDSGGDGWFCGTACSGVNADAYRDAALSDPTSIPDASLFTYLPGSFVGYDGDTIFYRSSAGYYGALVIDRIYTNPAYPPPPGGAWVPHTILEGTWYFQDDGSADFTTGVGPGPAPIPEPTSLVLLGTGLAGAARAWRKRKR
jgi:hypothetical protein